MAVFNEPTKWQTSLVNSGDANTIPQNTPAGTGEASFEDGFPPITQVPIGAGGQAPDRKDFNGLFKILGDWIFFAQNGGLPTYSANFDYVAGRVVLYNGNLYKCIQANGASSIVVAPDSVSPLGTDYWKDIENQDSTSLIPNQIIQSPVPLTDANLHLLDGALLSGSGAYSAYVAMMANLYNADPTATCWTDEVTWQSSVSTYGECGKFVYDSVNNTLRLPKLKSFIQATTTATELGSLVEAGAPNITGNTGSFDWQNNLASGAFIENPDISINYLGTAGNVSPISFDASRSSSVYGNSNTIQPQAIKYYFYIVVGTVSKTDIQIDIDNVMTDLALKADTDLSNTSPSQTFKNMFIGWGLPDYTSAITLTKQDGTAPSDGYLIAEWTYNAGEAYINIDGFNLSISSSYYNRISFMFPIRKNGAYSCTDWTRCNVLSFVPCKGAN